MNDLLKLLEFATSGFWRFVGCFLLLSLPTGVVVAMFNAVGSFAIIKHSHNHSHNHVTKGEQNAD